MKSQEQKVENVFKKYIQTLESKKDMYKIHVADLIEVVDQSTGREFVASYFPQNKGKYQIGERIKSNIILHTINPSTIKIKEGKLFYKGSEQKVISFIDEDKLYYGWLSAQLIMSAYDKQIKELENVISFTQHHIQKYSSQ